VSSLLATSDRLRVAILGNMNNNGFALMRFFIDLGVDAYLFPFRNDGEGSLAHFSPLSDSDDSEQYQGRIKRLAQTNSIEGLLAEPIANAVRWLRRVRRPGLPRLDPQTGDLLNHALVKELQSFDYIIGSGVAPGLLSRFSVHLTVFFPYAIGVEWYRTYEFLQELASQNRIKRLLARSAARSQAEGIRLARIVVCDPGPTATELSRLGVQPRHIGFPMVYFDQRKSQTLPSSLAGVAKSINRFEFKVLHHARLLFEKPPSYSVTAWKLGNKNSDWAIRGFAEFVGQTPGCSAVMTILEYGPDLDAAKRLVTRLGINDHVVWVPKQPRKHLLPFMALFDAAFGQFLTTRTSIWGGVGWEILAAGKPFIQGHFFDSGEFEALYGVPEPPLLKVQEPEDVALRLAWLYANPQARLELASRTVDWNSRYQGHALAAKWLEMLRALPSQRRL